MEAWIFFLIFVYLGVIGYFAMGKIDKFLDNLNKESRENGNEKGSATHMTDPIKKLFKKKPALNGEKREAGTEMNTESANRRSRGIRGWILRLKPSYVILLGFMAIILIGASLLTLPLASREGIATDPVNALFVATTATCVTGLVPFDTYTHWSLFGQIVILVLIQIGGLGLMTIILYIFGFTRHKIGLTERSIMQDSISAPSIGGIVRMAHFAFKVAFILEGIGAIALSFRFCPQFGMLKGIYYSIFHSVSAFCNAGIDLMGTTAPYSSLTGYSGDVLVNVTVMALIVLGGLGFIVWNDIAVHKFRFREYRMHTKVVLVSTLVLILSGALLFYIFESGNSVFEGKDTGERILNSFFQSVTPRTAGFNTVDLTKITSPSAMLLTVLMVIGGAPGSTAGGIKVTTFALLLLCVVSVIKKRSSTECFGRRISDESFKKAFTIFLIYLVLILFVSTVISHVDDVSFKAAIFEASSAAGTVGLSLGITPHLGNLSKVLLILLMYFGRVGCLTIVYSLFGKIKEQPNHLPEGKLEIG